MKVNTLSSYRTYVIHAIFILFLTCSQTEDEPGLLQQVQATICENIGLYINKYEEEFVKYLPTFVEDIWKLLIKLGPEPKYDNVRDFMTFFPTLITFFS